MVYSGMKERLLINISHKPAFSKRSSCLEAFTFSDGGY